MTNSSEVAAPISSDPHDHDQIAAVLEQYIEGARCGGSSEMKSAFHENASIFGHVSGSVWGGPIQKFFDYNDKNGPATDIKFRIASIDVAFTVATARLEIDGWTGHRYTDLFTLLKFNGEWKITNKVFHLHSSRRTVC